MKAKQCILLAIVIHLFFSCNNENKNNNKPNINVGISSDQIPEITKDLLDDINSKLVYSKVADVNNFLNNSDLKPPKKSLVITIKEEYLKDITNFDVFEYSKETGGSYSRLPFNKIFSRIDSVYTRKENFAEALKKIEVEADFKILKVKSSLAPLIEAYYILRILAEKKFRKIDIFIRGYADGKLSDWDRPLTEKYDDISYQEFAIHKSVYPNSENEFLFFPTESIIKVNSSYNNKELPNLRAKFIKREIIDTHMLRRLIAFGIPKENITTGILEGYEYKKINLMDRKVEIYVNIY